jgi:hypothetical protein
MLAVTGDHKCKGQNAKCKVQNGQASRLSATIDHRPSTITYDRRSTRFCFGSLLLFTAISGCGGGTVVLLPDDLPETRREGSSGFDAGADLQPEVSPPRDSWGVEAGRADGPATPDLEAREGRPGPDLDIQAAELPAEVAEVEAGPELPLPVPCVTEADCDDGQFCTLDLCQDGYCAHEPKPAGTCCQSNAECDDGNPCTTDECKGIICIHTKESNLCCTLASECDDLDSCTLDSCTGNLCQHAPDPACCLADAQCDDANPCTEDHCTDLHCTHAPVSGLQVQELFNFDDGSLAGFVVTEDGSKVKWQLTKNKAMSSPYSLYFGDPAGPTINNGKAVKGTVTTPPIALAAQGPFLFKAWANLQIEPLYSKDLATISLLTAGEETVIWTKVDIGGSTGKAWKEIEIDLAKAGDLAGKSIQLKLSFDSLDGVGNDYEGLYFDDLRVLWPCP